MFVFIRIATLIVLVHNLVACNEEKPQEDQFANAKAFEIGQLISTKCSSCHNGSSVNSDFRPTGEADSLVDQGYVVPGNVSASRIVPKLSPHGVQKEIPLKVRLQQRKTAWPTDEQKETLIDWIKNGAGSFYVSEFKDHTPADTLKEIKKDYAQLPNEKKASVRYLYFTHYLNFPVKSKVIDAIAPAVNLAVNSISTADRLKPAFFFGPDKLIVRLDASDYGWTTTKWDRFSKSYPFENYFDANDEIDFRVDIKSTTGVGHPIVRGDWFLNHAVAEANYYRFLEIPQTLDGFVKYIGVDLTKRYKEARYIRASFVKSGVSTHNRSIERHERDGDGFLWRSFEFANDTGTNSVMDNPFGPNETIASDEGAGADPSAEPSTVPAPTQIEIMMKEKSFTPQGSEFIFNLKNGMLGYYIVQGNDALRSAPAAGGLPAVRVGISCMRCHESLIFRKDEVMQKYSRGGLPQELLAELGKVHLSSTELQAKITRDSATFRRAMRDLDIDINNQQPVVAISDYYTDRPLHIPQIFAELGLGSPEKFKNTLFFKVLPQQRQNILSQFSRENMEARFDDLKKIIVENLTESAGEGVTQPINNNGKLPEGGKQ